jgi:hypothetical protein
MGGQDRNPSDQGGRHCAKKYCNDEWKRFSQLCAHCQFPHPLRPLILIRRGLKAYAL